MSINSDWWALMKNLVIVGNGFDLHHGLKASYSHFCEYVKANNHELYEYIDEYLDQYNLNWNDIETLLGIIDLNDVLDKCNEELVGYGVENWSEDYHHAPQRVAENFFNNCSIALKQELLNWMIVLDGCINTQKSLNKLESTFLKNNNIYLSFNYTSTLQQLYLVSDSNILHVHGSVQKVSITNQQNTLVFGHADKEYITHQYFKEHLFNENTDTRIMACQDILNKYHSTTYKDSHNYITRYKNFFDQIYDVKNVIVLGHSYGSVDLDYFLEILARSPDAQWYCYAYHKKDIDNCRKILSANLPLSQYLISENKTMSEFLLFVEENII